MRAAGRKVFHVSIINWSYRRRGRVARIHTNRAAMNSVMDGKVI